MTTEEYLNGIHLYLVECPIVSQYTVVRQRASSQTGYLRVRIYLSNGDFLEAAEFFRMKPDGIQVADYRHQWMNGGRIVLKTRWDSAHIILNWRMPLIIAITVKKIESRQEKRWESRMCFRSS